MGKHSQYGVILDAGSSGTRVYVYKWKDPARTSTKASPEKLQKLPKLKLKEQKKIHPGVSTFAENVASVGPDHLQELINVALDEVPDDKIAETPIFLMATAGVRFLPQDQQTELLGGICSWLQQNTKFSLPDCDAHVQVISGETEGLYGWLAANYLLGGFDDAAAHDHGKGGHHTYGFLDMGGASAQIAFAPNTTEAEKHADDLKLVRLRHLDGNPIEYRVFTTTWLGFGANKARERYVESLREGYDEKNDELPDPCLPKGLRTTLDGHPTSHPDKDTVLVGTGKFEECLKRTYPLLGKDEPCEEEPCLLNGQHVPAIDFDVNRFIGVSEYWHTTHGVFGGKHKAYDLATYQHNVMDFCTRDWDDIEDDLDKRKKTPEEKAQDAMEACFKASWLINVLYDGIGIPRVGLEGVASPGINTTKEALEDAQDSGFADPFRPVDKIDGVELSWTLGKMVLYAAGQVPPKEEKMPVGFGDNVVGGAPLHFEEAGSTPLTPSSGDDDDDDWDMPISTPSKNTSGVLALVGILLFLAWFLRKPERRQRLFRFARGKKPGSGRRGLRSFPFASKFFGRNTTAYERILEEGDAAEFELGDVESSDDNEQQSDSSDGSRRRGRNSGISTPKPGPSGDSKLRPPSALDREGLVVRTESRERLAAMGRRSRTGSPSSRPKSSLMSTLAED